MTDNANSAANHVHPPAPSAAAASIGDEVNGGSSGGARGYPTGTTAAASASAAAAGSTTITITNTTPQQQQQLPHEVLRLTLRPRPNVTWCVSKRKFRLATRHDYWKTIFCVRGVEAASLRFVLFAHD